MSELIDKAVLMEKMHKYGFTAPDMTVHEFIEDELPTIPAPRWRRVEEPPKEEGKYLVYDGCGNYHVAWWGQRLGWCYDPKFFCYWMPIEPPKEDA